MNSPPPTSPSHNLDQTVASDISPRSLAQQLSSGAVPESLGRYRIVRLLGEGAMGSVYLGHDDSLDRPVALKIPKFDEDENPRNLERFLREAQAAA